jgi:hypothetical protein
MKGRERREGLRIGIKGEDAPACRVVLSQYVTLTHVAQIKSTAYHVYWK